MISFYSRVLEMKKKNQHSGRKSRKGKFLGKEKQER